MTRLRPGLVFQRGVAAELRGLFLGHLVPMSIVRAARFAVLPLPLPFVFQAVHADDLADAFWRAIDRGPPGRSTSPRRRCSPRRGWRGRRGCSGRCGSAAAAARDRHPHLATPLQPTDAGWLDIAAGVPIMRTDRARRELGWEPQHTAEEALRELVGGFADGANVEASGPLRG